MGPGRTKLRQQMMIFISCDGYLILPSGGEKNLWDSLAECSADSFCVNKSCQAGS